MIGPTLISGLVGQSVIVRVAKTGGLPITLDTSDGSQRTIFAEAFQNGYVQSRTGAVEFFGLIQLDGPAAPWQAGGFCQLPANDGLFRLDIPAEAIPCGYSVVGLTPDNVSQGPDWTCEPTVCG
jgi:hypothetical protein